MRLLFTVGLTLAALFASTFLIIKATGVLTVDDIKAFLTAANDSASIAVAGAVVLILAADLFIAVPTLTTTILSGYFLGFPFGFAAALTGLSTAGLLGYAICRRYGPGLLNRIAKNKDSLDEMFEMFGRYGIVVLVICRAAPILPEVSCCLAGATRMPLKRFLPAFLLGTVPYALIAAYAGSKSTLDDPMPAILTAVGLSAALSIAWMVLIRRHRATQKA